MRCAKKQEEKRLGMRLKSGFLHVHAAGGKSDVACVVLEASK